MQWCIEPPNPVWVVGHGALAIDGGARPVPPGAGDELTVWRRHLDVTPGRPAWTCLEAAEVLHDRRVIARLEALARAYEPSQCCLVYVHRGYQPQYRTPLLQSLLAALPRYGAVASLRSAAALLPLEAVTLALAYLGPCEHVVILRDGVERLGADAGDTLGGEVEHLVLSRQEGACRLDRIRIEPHGDACVAHGPRPIGMPSLQLRLAEAFGGTAFIETTGVHHDCYGR